MIRPYIYHHGAFMETKKKKWLRIAVRTMLVIVLIAFTCRFIPVTPKAAVRLTMLVNLHPVHATFTDLELVPHESPYTDSQYGLVWGHCIVKWYPMSNATSESQPYLDYFTIYDKGWYYKAPPGYA